MKQIRQLYFKAKKTAQKLHNIIAGTVWFDCDDEDEVDARATLAIKSAGYKRSDFFKPVRVDHLVVDDMPLEGVFDTKFCERYGLAEDGKSWILPALTPAPDPVPESDEAGTAVSAGGTDTSGTDASADAGAVSGDAAALPAYEFNVNGEPMSEVEKKMLQPVAGMSDRHRILSQFILEDEFSHRVSPEQLADIQRTEMDMANGYIQDMLLACNNVPAVRELDTPNLWQFTDAVKRVFSQDKRHPVNTLVNFAKAFTETDSNDRDLLIKEWCEGRRVSRVEHVTMPETSNDDTAPAQAGTKTAVTERPRRSEKPTHRTINHEIGCGLYDGELDLHNLREPLAFAKRIMTKDREDWKVWSATINCIPGILNYDRQTIIEMVRKAPTPTYHSAALRREWCDSYLRAWGRLDPDWGQSAAVKTAESHEDVCADIRKAGKRLREIESGIGINEEKQTIQGELADEPSAPESVEPASTEHQQNTQPLDAEASVENDKKRREQVSEQLAAERGDFVPGISDPGDPKWVHSDYGSSNEVEKEEKEETPSDVVSGSPALPEPSAPKNGSETPSAAPEGTQSAILENLQKNHLVLTQILACLLRAEKGRRKEVAAVRGMLTMLSDVETGGGENHGE